MCSFASIIFCVLCVMISYNFKVLSNCVIEDPSCRTFFSEYLLTNFDFQILMSVLID